MGPVNNVESTEERLPHLNGFVERYPQAKGGLEQPFLTNGHAKRVSQSDGRPGGLAQSNGHYDNFSQVNSHTESHPLHSNGDVDLPPQANWHVKFKSPEKTTKNVPNRNDENEGGKRKHSRQFDFPPQRHRQDASPCRKRDVRSPVKDPTIKALQEKLKASSRFAITSPTLSPSPSRSNINQDNDSAKPSQFPFEKQKVTTVASPDRRRSRSPSQRLPSTSQFKSPKKIQYSSPSRATIRPSVRSAIKAHNKQVCNSPVRNKLNTSVWVHHTGSIPKEHIQSTKEFSQKYLTIHNEEADAVDESDAVENGIMAVNDQPCSCDYSIPKAFNAHTYKIEVHATDDKEERGWSNKLKDVSSIIRIPSESLQPDENIETDDRASAENVNNQEGEEVTSENKLSDQPAEAPAKYFPSTPEEHINTETPLDFSTKLKEADESFLLAFQNTPPVFAYYIDGINGRGGMALRAQEVEDLIHLAGPLTEDAVLKTLQARFMTQQNYTNVGPILLSINPYNDVGNALTLTSTRTAPQSPHLLRVVHEAVRQQSETGYPQAIILSGSSGSGKTYLSMLLLRQLFDVAGGGLETDAFKHLAAAFTVLRSLGSAKTTSNSESSRIGHFIEVQVTDGALYRTKIHCYFLDQTRVVRPLPDEKNYHIFYQMLAGLTQEERAKLHLQGHSVRTLRYLSEGDIRQDEANDARRFEAWKACLGVLGIQVLDVVRVLAAILLLGNVTFIEGQGLEVDIQGGSHELKSVAALLGVSSAALYSGLTTRTHNVRGQLVKSMLDANMSNLTRDALSKALYCRTVATIVRRANSLKRLGSTSGTLSSDSNESVHHQVEVASRHASTVGTAGSKASKSMSVLNSAVKHATDGFIGILDMFGFEEPKPAHLEHLCINLCAETMQHFYNTHIFKSSIESCREEGIACEVEVDYVDNVPCIDLISSLRTGLLSILDLECSVRSTPENYIQKVKVQHKGNLRLFEPKTNIVRTFGIHHFASRVVYDASNFLDTNKDILSDDMVSVFQKQNCNFGFATHLFGSELKALYSQEPVPRGMSFRISPTSHTDLQNGYEPISTLTQDFHTRLDNLLRTLVHAKPHFIRCIRANATEKPSFFDRATVIKQIRALQVLETVNLMAGGFPHRMRFKTFSLRYRLLAPFKRLRRTEDKTVDDCKLILEYFMKQLEDICKNSTVLIQWALGKRHIFLSEGARQQLEILRIETRHRAATLIQAIWRGWHLRRKWPNLRRNLELRARTRPIRPRPQPIAGTPPPEVLDRCSQKAIQQTCSRIGLDLERPPPVPPSRPYTITGNHKLGYPQTRVMNMGYPEDGSGDIVLRKGQTVLVIGASPQRGNLLVEYQGHSVNVPYQFMELSAQPGVSI